eukprot:XP_011671552.1 PREDICTED: uncharacterized protein LOC105441785 [Strongylocentrotus purpuratus]
MDSITKPVLYVHSSVKCDVCKKHPAEAARHFCGHDACKEHMYMCNSCNSYHITFTRHSEFLQRVVVSEVESKCYKPGHSERLASHICVTCKKPLCDDCRDDHHDQGHPFTEIQSAVAAIKIEISKSLDQLKDQVKHSQEMCANALDLEARVNDKFDALSKDVETNIKNVLQVVENDRSSVLRELEVERQQLLKDLRPFITPSQDQTAASSEVIFLAQEFINCGDATEILSNHDRILQRTKEEVDRAGLSDALCLNPVMSRMSRMSLVPEVRAYDVGQVRCLWEQVCSVPLSEVGKAGSFLAPLPNGGFVLGASHNVSQSLTSAADLVFDQEQVEMSRYDTKLSIYADNGKLINTKNIEMLLGNGSLRGITVLPCGEIAVLGKHIQIYGLDLEFLRDFKPVAGHDWYSIAVGPSGTLLAGDCLNGCIDFLSAEGLIDHSISCSGVKPRHLHALPTGSFVISQPGIEDSEPIIKILNPDGSEALSLSDSSWQYVYCSADNCGNLYVADLKIVESKEDIRNTDAPGAIKARLTFDRYTRHGKRKETIVKDVIIENCLYISIAAQKDGRHVALSSKDKFWIFR